MLTGVLQQLHRRFEAARFQIEEDVPVPPYRVEMVASHMTFSFPNYHEEFFVFSRFPTLEMGGLLEYADAAFKYTLTHRRPRSWWKHKLIGVHLFTYAIAVMSEAAEPLLNALRDSDPVHHLMLGWAIPVLYDEKARAWHRFGKTSWVQGAAYKYFHKVIRKWLEPAG